MSYESRIDEMVGQHVKIFQDELSLAKVMESHAKAHSAMPYGYPIAVYRPMHICRFPGTTKYVPCNRDKLSNGVPRVLAMDLANQYVLGLYNPKQTCWDRESATDRPRTRGSRSGLLEWTGSLPSNQAFAAH